METLIKEKHIEKIAKNYTKNDLTVKLLVLDYKWEEDGKSNFYYIYALVNVHKVDRVFLIGSRDGEMWDLQLSFEEICRFDEEQEQYALFKLFLNQDDVFPRSFVIKGVGEQEFYDNNENKNFSIKKGRGGNIIPRRKEIILLNTVELYSIYEK